MNRAIRHEELLEQMPWVQRLARRLVSDPNDADDVAQSVWLMALERPPRSATSGIRLKGWLSSVLRTAARDRRRSEERRTKREAKAARNESQPSTDEVVERSLLQKELVETVLELDEPYRSTILLRYLDNLTAPEIAEKTDVSPACVRKRLSRATAILREKLDLDDWQSRKSFAIAILGPVAFEGATAKITTGAATNGATMLGLKMKLAVGATAMTGALVVAQANDSGRDAVAEAVEVVEAIDLDAETAAVPEPQDEEAAKLTVAAGQVAPSVQRDDAQRSEAAKEPLYIGPHDASQMDLAELARSLGLEGSDLNQLCVRDPSGKILEAKSCTTCHVSSSPSLEQGPPDRFETLYDEGGATSAQGPIRNHQRFGLWTEFRPDGTKAVEGHYFAGEPHGAWTTWHESGKQKSAGDYFYGKPEGTWTRWHEDGSQMSVAEYRNGQRHGAYVERHADGSVKVDGAYHSGSEDGPFLTYYPNGQLQSRGSYRYGNRVGPWLFWTAEGAVDELQSGTYADGKKLGSDG